MKSSGRAPEWRLRVAFLVALLSATVLVSLLDVFWRVDIAIFDAASPTGPAPEDVVIVAIDDGSIAQLGRWPWPRAVHAALLDRLREADARAVALDILFTEPESSSGAGDLALAAAMRRGPPTVLPLLADLPGESRRPRERLPIPVLAEAAAALGHAHLELDPDGIVRSVFLREGPGEPTRDYLTLALLGAAPGAPRIELHGERYPGRAADHLSAWVRDYRMFIPFLGPPGHFKQLSYVDVLRGDMNPDLLRGKLVLVGGDGAGPRRCFRDSAFGPESADAGHRNRRKRSAGCSQRRRNYARIATNRDTAGSSARRRGGHRPATIAAQAGDDLHVSALGHDARH